LSCPIIGVFRGSSPRSHGTRIFRALTAPSERNSSVSRKADIWIPISRTRGVHGKSPTPSGCGASANPARPEGDDVRARCRGASAWRCRASDRWWRPTADVVRERPGHGAATAIIVPVAAKGSGRDGMAEQSTDRQAGTAPREARPTDDANTLPPHWQRTATHHERRPWQPRVMVLCSLTALGPPLFAWRYERTSSLWIYASIAEAIAAAGRPGRTGLRQFQTAAGGGDPARSIRTSSTFVAPADRQHIVISGCRSHQGR
jgi:hypothetical protein